MAGSKRNKVQRLGCPWVPVFGLAKTGMTRIRYGN
jgi:hypothetical protein